MKENKYTISEAARLLSVENHVLRYWEEELELNIPRNELGHRYYREEEIQLLHCIKELKNKGFQLKAVKEVLPDLEQKKLIDIHKLLTTQEELENQELEEAQKEAEQQRDSQTEREMQRGKERQNGKENEQQRNSKVYFSEENDRDTFENNKKLLQGTAKGTLDITKDLKWNLSLSYQDEQYIWNEYHTSKSQYNTRNGEAKRIATENKKKILETYINYDHTFANIHKLGLMAGYSWEQNDDNDSFGLDVYDFYNDNTTFYNLNLANKMDWQNGGITSNNNGHLETLRMISFYGRINYSFNLSLIHISEPTRP